MAKAKKAAAPPEAPEPAPAPVTERVDPIAPTPGRNLVVYLAEDLVVERTDDLNWTAKRRKAIDVTHHKAKKGGAGYRWEILGYYSTPASAFRRLLSSAVAAPGSQELSAFVQRIEEASQSVSKVLRDAERATALYELAGELEGAAADRARSKAQEYLRSE